MNDSKIGHIGEIHSKIGQITPNFSYREMVKTNTGLLNHPTPEAIRNMKRLCVDIMEPIRALLGVPLVIHSGYRSKVVNQRVGGASNSAHLAGLAADFHPLSDDPIPHSFHRILESGIAFEKIILEFHGATAWIHVEAPPDGAAPGRRAYFATVTNTGTSYRPARV